MIVIKKKLKPELNVSNMASYFLEKGLLKRLSEYTNQIIIVI